MRRLLLIAVVAIALAGCRGPHPPVPDPSHPTTTTRPAPPRFRAVLDDHGLHMPPGPILAGHYRISFVDRRTNRLATDRVVWQVRPSGPMIVLLQVLAGTTTDGLLLANESAQVELNGALLRNYRIDHQLDVRPSPQFPTPVT